MASHEADPQPGTAPTAEEHGEETQRDVPGSEPQSPSTAATDTQRTPPPMSLPRTRSGSVTSNADGAGELSAGATDRVFPIRSVVSVDPTPTPTQAGRHEGYFPSHGRSSDSRRRSVTSSSDTSRTRQGSEGTVRGDERCKETSTRPSRKSESLPRQTTQYINDVLSGTGRSEAGTDPDESIAPVPSDFSGRSSIDEPGGLLTARFKHVVQEGGHLVITGRDGDTLQRCEDEPIHIPGAVQSFGLLIALQEDADGRLVVRIVSENSQRIIGYTPTQLFALDSFCDILSEEQADNLMDHVDFIKDDDVDVTTNGPEVFTISVRAHHRKSIKLWCAMHMNLSNPDLIICEFELEDDPINPQVPPDSHTPEMPEDTLSSEPTAEELAESTESTSRPLRVLRGARKRKGEAAAMEVFNIMSQVQEQLASAPNLDAFLKVLVGVVKELTGFHRVMIYQFDQSWAGRVVTELLDPRATKDLYKGLSFPASDIPQQARELYKINKVRLLYDRAQETARLVCRTAADLETPLDLTFAYLRAMSPIHIKYLENMAVRSSMSISINAFDELWGLISCHSYGQKGMRVSFPIRKMCRLIGDSASRNIERLSYASRLQARKLINTAPSQHNPSGYIIASSEDLLKLFNADFGLLSIRDETKILGDLEHSQEALAMLEYLRLRRLTSVVTSLDIAQDFPDLRYPPGFSVIAGMLFVPLSTGGQDFIVFFRKGQAKEVKWAGNPYEKFIREGTEGYLEPRKSFKTWTETVVGKCRDWTEEEVETAAVLCLVYGKFIEVWRQKEAALQSSQLTRLLLANSAHEVRTPLNAIINYLEIALEGSLDSETRDNLSKSHSASKSLIYVINDLLDLTKTEEGVALIKGEPFDLRATLHEATGPFVRDAQRKSISLDVMVQPSVPQKVVGDQRRVRQAISNVAANAIQCTSEGGVKVEMSAVSYTSEHTDIEIVVQDTGIGMDGKQLDSLFRDLEQVQSETGDLLGDALAGDPKKLTGAGQEKKQTLGLGLAVVARVVRNMNGQLRLKSELGKGSRFVILLPFDLPENASEKPALTASALESSLPPQPELEAQEEVMLVDREAAHHRRGSNGRGMTRRTSADSMESTGRRSMQSNSSIHSGRSDVDRLIEAIQEPHLVESRPQERSFSSHSTRPRLEQRFSWNASAPSSPHRVRSKSVDHREVSIPEHLRSTEVKAGQASVQSSATPVKAIRVPEEFSSPSDTKSVSRILGEAEEQSEEMESNQMKAPNADHMRVLVAEDDPVNSRIVQKRLEKVGHEVYLTVNGEECASAYGDKAGYFDVILMDMQMPIVDGLTSTKLIRSFEKSHPTHMLSTRASLNGRVPILAVSASLIEKEHQTYIDAGFDGWILKPISFSRLSELMTGIVDPEIRNEALYRPGVDWEKGGWFNQGQPDIFAASTTPSRQEPTRASSEIIQEGAGT